MSASSGDGAAMPSPASEVAQHTTVASYDDVEALKRFSASVHVITYEFENIPAASVKLLTDHVPVRPGPDILHVSQHRVLEKQAINALGIATAPFAPVSSLEELQALEDVGPKVAGSILQFFENKDNIKMLLKLESLGLNFRSTRSERKSGGTLAEQSFLFTGTLNELKRSEAEALVESQGGKILGGVSSKLNYLVVGEDAGSKLEKAKKIPSIRILTEKEFLRFIGSPDRK